MLSTVPIFFRRIVLFSVNRLLALILIVSMTIPSALGSSTPKAGVIVAARGAQLRNAAATAGTTVFPGDVLSTQARGEVQIHAGAARLYLGESSGATLTNEAGIPSATLLKGMAVFSTSHANDFVLIAAAAQIRARADAYTVAQVSVAGPRELIVTSRRGALTITLGEETEILPEAASYRVLLDPVAEPEPAPDPQGPRGAGTGPHKRPRRAAKDRLHVIPIALITVLTGFAAYKVFESPDRP